MSVFRDLRIRITSLLLLFISTFCHADLNDGLVAYFPLDGNATDMVTGVNGTIHGGANSVPNRLGLPSSAYSFDGVDDYIEAPYNSSYSSNEFSFSLWVNPSANTSSYQSPFTFRGTHQGFLLYKDPILHHWLL